MKEQERYYKLLKLQYYKATKNKIETKIESSLTNDVYKWLEIRRNIGEKYKLFLSDLGIVMTTKEKAEVGKGIFDTLVRAGDATLITPYIKSNDNKRILSYDLILSENSIALAKYGEKYRLEEITSSPKDITTYMTQNPYQKNDLFGWKNLANNSKYNTIIGMYGEIQDKDKNAKLKMLKEIRDKIVNNEYKLVYESDKDYYYASLITKTK